MQARAQTSDSWPVPFRLGLVGTGMIGGSLALAAKRAGIVTQVLGFDPGEGVPEQALALGILDHACSSVRELAGNCDLVLVATPVSVVATCVRECLDAGANWVMEVGSVKGQVLEALGELVGTDGRFVSVHPVAGTDQSGPGAACADMFVDRLVVILTTGNPSLRRTAERLWSLCGAQCVEMSPESHDQLLAATSHLPHLLAFCYVMVLADKQPESLRQVVGPGFRDFTRIAQADARVWQSIFTANQDELRELIGRFQVQLAQFENWLDQPDAMQDALHKASEVLTVLR